MHSLPAELVPPPEVISRTHGTSMRVTHNRAQIQNVYGGSAETQWLAKAGLDLLERIECGGDIAIYLETLEVGYQTDGDIRQLIEGSVGVVALFGLPYVWEGRIRARDILEATPNIIINAASEGPEGSVTFYNRISEATDKFCAQQQKQDSGAGTGLYSSSLLSAKSRRIEDIATKAKDGNEQATSELVATFKPIILGIMGSKGFFLQGGDTEDLYQEGLVGLVEALGDHDPSTSSFGSFARMLITRRMSDAVKSASRHKHTLLTQAASLDAPVSQKYQDKDGATLGILIEDPRDMYRTVIARETICALFVASLRLSDLELECHTLLTQGFSYDQILEQTGIPRKKIAYSAVERARRVYARVLEEYS